MGKTNAAHPSPHQQQSMVLVPMDTPGVTIVRALSFCGHAGAPAHLSLSFFSCLSSCACHASRRGKPGRPRRNQVCNCSAPHRTACWVVTESRFDNVCVPLDNILLGEGRGFEIAQGRLGPGRVHHCMRLIGLGSRALNLMVLRASARSAFGKQLSANECVLRDIAETRLKVCDAAPCCFMFQLQIYHYVRRSWRRCASSRCTLPGPWIASETRLVFPCDFAPFLPRF